MVWKLLTPFMDPSTLEKTSILGSDYLPALLAVMPEEAIPTNMGGKGPILPSGGIYYRVGEKGDGASKYSTTVVGRASSYKQELNVSEPAKLSWEFLTQDYDIKFGLYLKISDTERQILIAPAVKNSHEVTIKDSYEATKPGVYILEWDNSYSWTRSKSLSYFIDLHPLTSPQ